MKTKNVIWRQYYWTISATVLLALLAGSGFKDTHWVIKQVMKSSYPIEKLELLRDQ